IGQFGERTIRPATEQRRKTSANPAGPMRRVHAGGHDAGAPRTTKKAYAQSVEAHLHRQCGGPPRLLRFLPDRLRHAALTKEWSLPYWQGGAILLASGLGAVPGAFVWGWLGDRIGRRIVFIWSAVTISLATGAHTRAQCDRAGLALLDVFPVLCRGRQRRHL